MRLPRRKASTPEARRHVRRPSTRSRRRPGHWSPRCRRPASPRTSAPSGSRGQLHTGERGCEAALKQRSWLHRHCVRCTTTPPAPWPRRAWCEQHTPRSHPKSLGNSRPAQEVTHESTTSTQVRMFLKSCPQTPRGKRGSGSLRPLPLPASLPPPLASKRAPAPPGADGHPKSASDRPRASRAGGEEPLRFVCARCCVGFGPGPSPHAGGLLDRKSVV